MAELNEHLVKDFAKAVEQQEETMQLVRAQEAKVAELEKRHGDQEKIITTLQKAEQVPSRVRLAALGRYTGGKGVGRLADWDQEQKEIFLEFVTAIVKQDNEVLKDWYDRNGITKAGDMVEGTPNKGGYAVPDQFIPEILRLIGERSVYMSDARRIPMNTMLMKMPTKATSWTAHWADEATSVTEGTPTLGQLSFTATKLMGYGHISSELLEDSAPDIVEFLIEQAIETAALEIDKGGFLNKAANAPSGSTGILYAATSKTNVVAADYTMTYDEIIDGIHGLPANAARGARIYLSRYVHGKVRKVKDDDSRPIMQPEGLGWPGASPTIAGIPYTIVDVLPGTAEEAAAAKDDPFMLFGNLGNLPYGDRREFNFARDDSFLFASDQTALRFTMRIGYPSFANAAEVTKWFMTWATAP